MRSILRLKIWWGCHLQYYSLVRYTMSKHCFQQQRSIYGKLKFSDISWIQVAVHTIRIIMIQNVRLLNKDSCIIFYILSSKRMWEAIMTIFQKFEVVRCKHCHLLYKILFYGIFQLFILLSSFTEYWHYRGWRKWRFEVDYQMYEMTSFSAMNLHLWYLFDFKPRLSNQLS